MGTSHRCRPWFSPRQKTIDPSARHPHLVYSLLSFSLFAFSFVLGLARSSHNHWLHFLSHSSSYHSFVQLYPGGCIGGVLHNEPLALTPVSAFVVIVTLPYLPYLLFASCAIQGQRLRIIVDRQYVFLCSPGCGATRLEGWINPESKGDPKCFIFEKHILHLLMTFKNICGSKNCLFYCIVRQRGVLMMVMRILLEPNSTVP